jgi:hypothetical protein
MNEPPPKISKRPADTIWPVRVSILSLQPWKRVLQFVDVRSESDAVSEIYAAITKCETLCAEQILSVEATEINGRTDKNGLEPLLPSRRKVTCKRTRPIVQPVVLKRASLGRTLMAKPREVSAISFGISGCRMSQSFVKWKRSVVLIIS